LLSAAQATLMMTLWRPTPPRVMALDVLVPVVPVCLWGLMCRLSIMLMSLCRRLLLLAALATLMMTLWRPTPPRVMTLDVLVPVVPVAPAEQHADVALSQAVVVGSVDTGPVAPAEHHADVAVSQAAVACGAGDLDDDAMAANAASRDVLVTAARLTLRHTPLLMAQFYQLRWYPQHCQFSAPVVLLIAFKRCSGYGF
jgi:hypothetical protein